MAVADDEVPVLGVLQTSGPGQFDLRAGDFFRDVPDDFFLRRNFNDAVPTSGRDQRVAVLQTNRSINPRVGKIFPDNLAPRYRIR